MKSFSSFVKQSAAKIPLLDGGKERSSMLLKELPPDESSNVSTLSGAITTTAAKNSYINKKEIAEIRKQNDIENLKKYNVSRCIKSSK